VNETCEHSGPDAVVEICKAASDPLRLEIMRVLSKDSFGVQELAHIFSVPQPGMSHHLKILFKSGLLVTRRQGNSIFYRRTLLREKSEMSAFQTSLFNTIDALPLAEKYAPKIATVYKDRSAQSKLYFERNVDRFAENQGMLCELTQYFSNLKELLELMELPPAGRVMEVGPGQGLLLAELAKNCGHLVALDNSDQMLQFTKDNLRTQSKNIEFVNCPLENYPVADANFDAVVLNMVMHHLPSPAGTFLKLRELISPAGFLLIADLTSHDQDWARESCGDLWLGFDPEDLNHWARAAGFDVKQSLFLGLKNGFQIQIKLFGKS
jgi:ubiquinone/menaquinone biosynthesis C-methylase UbiE